MPVTAKPTSYTAGAATLRPNHLWMFQAVVGGSVLGTDVATTDYTDASRVLATADKGAYERA